MTMEMILHLSYQRLNILTALLSSANQGVMLVTLGLSCHNCGPNGGLTMIYLERRLDQGVLELYRL